MGSLSQLITVLNVIIRTLENHTYAYGLDFFSFSIFISLAFVTRVAVANSTSPKRVLLINFRDAIGYGSVCWKYLMRFLH